MPDCRRWTDARPYRPAIHTVWLLVVHVNTIKELQVMFDGATVRVRAATNAPRPWNVLRSVHVSFRPAPLRAFVVNITSAISPPVGPGYPPAGTHLPAEYLVSVLPARCLSVSSRTATSSTSRALRRSRISTRSQRCSKSTQMGKS